MAIAHWAGPRPRREVDTFAAPYPQLQEIDFRETAAGFETSVFFVQGRTRRLAAPTSSPSGIPLSTPRPKDRIVFVISGDSRCSSNPPGSSTTSSRSCCRGPSGVLPSVRQDRGPQGVGLTALFLDGRARCDGKREVWWSRCRL